MIPPQIEPVAKARLRNFGDGFLELTGVSVKFYVETGRFRKQRKTIIEISWADVENVERKGRDLSILWKGNTYIFVVSQPSQAEPIFTRIATELKERKKEAENKELADQRRKELAQMTTCAIETADSLFGILKTLHGLVDWKLVEDSFKQAEDNAGRLANQGANAMCLDVKQLSAAVQERNPKEIGEKTYDALKALYEHFDEPASSPEISEQIHPNHHAAKRVIQAYYVMNDIALGVVVGEDTVTKESDEFLKMLDELSKLPGSKININTIRTLLKKLCGEKEKQSLAVEEFKSTVGPQLKELIAPTPNLAQEAPST